VNPCRYRDPEFLLCAHSLFIISLGVGVAGVGIGGETRVLHGGETTYFVAFQPKTLVIASNFIILVIRIDFFTQ